MILHIIQARTESTRLPGKVWKEIKGKPLIEWHLLNTISPYQRVLAIPYGDPETTRFRKIAQKYNACLAMPKVPENDLLKRFIQAGKRFNPEWVIRTTADCFMDNEWFLKTIEAATSYDIPIFNTFKEGSCVEVFKYSFLLRADKEVKLKEHREHPTLYFRKGFKKESIDTLKEFQALKKRIENGN